MTVVVRLPMYYIHVYNRCRFTAGGGSQLQQVFIQRARQRGCVLFERHRQRFQND